MTGDIKKPQVVLALLVGVGLFLPAVSVSAYNQSVSASFMAMFTAGESIEGIIDAKIVMAVLVLYFIFLLVRIKNDGYIQKIISLLLIIITGVLFYIDMGKIGAAKSLFSSMFKYGIGYYMALVGIILAIICGLIDIFSEGSNSYRGSRRDYPVDYDEVIRNHYGSDDAAISIVPNQAVPKPKEETPPATNNGMRLSDLVNNENQSNNGDNINK